MSPIPSENYERYVQHYWPEPLPPTEVLKAKLWDESTSYLDPVLEDLNTIERIGKTMVFFGYVNLSFQAFSSWRAGRKGDLTDHPQNPYNAGYRGELCEQLFESDPPSPRLRRINSTYESRPFNRFRVTLGKLEGRQVGIRVSLNEIL